MGNIGKRAKVFIFSFILIAGARAQNPRVHIETDYGEIIIELFPDKAPRTVKNFLFLVNEQFYTGLTIHRIVPGFVIQGGDNRGNGTGGPGYTIPAEIHPDLKHEEGVVAMARLPDQVNPERRSSGSQFYITVAPTPQLDGKYTIFGKVVKGLDVAKKIVSLPRGPRDNPLQPVIMRKVYVEGNKEFLRAPQRCGPFTRS
ncbi:MAG: peptidylprolyl isomerase, partial [bacterium]